jgi:hypothetical protein
VALAAKLARGYELWADTPGVWAGYPTKVPRDGLPARVTPL